VFRTGIRAIAPSRACLWVVAKVDDSTLSICHQTRPGSAQCLQVRLPAAAALCPSPEPQSQLALSVLRIPSKYATSSSNGQLA
jgi:hypothetical protein